MQFSATPGNRPSPQFSDEDHNGFPEPIRRKAKNKSADL
jgi:hypothetical protein